MSFTRECVSVLLLGVVASSPLPAVPRARDLAALANPVAEYRSEIQLDMLTYELRPSRRPFYVTVSAIGTEFDGWKVLGREHHRYLVTSDGMRVTHYPEHIVFRVSAGAVDKRLMSRYRDAVMAQCDMNHLLLGLQFRLKLFRGVNARALHPKAVRHIGVPPEEPFEERTYLVSFDLPNVPISDRMVLEVITPEGERISKFHMDLY